MSESKNPNVSLPISTLIHDLLQDHHYVPISPITAEVILMHTGNKWGCHIQQPSDADVDILGRFIDTPMLWDFAAWKHASEKHLRDKILSQKRRDDKFIFDGNVKLIARNILKIAYITPDAATCLAHQWLTKKDMARIKVMGTKRLYENVRELPDK